eukprot:TRINITY_DN25296_c1_g1_i1.p1 TRINITY_DN25296_c1_g1~~TRINITY_DN25296_c1_g1_i1.p1  ORF type:complete len:319 (+),score=68.78 TRINITY_DN25296_c1_g1_i1:40-996(+)
MALFEPSLQAKVDEKIECAQLIIRNVEKACESNAPEDRDWLMSMITPNNPTFSTLVRLVYEPKYKGFLRLRCVALRAVQMLVRIASMTQTGSDANIGWKCFVELGGAEHSHQAMPEILRLAQQQDDPVVASNAITVLAEFGPQALRPENVPILLDLLQALPDRASDLSEVALRVHAWGGDSRRALCLATVQHPGGKLLIEVLLQIINRCDEKRQQRALKVLAGCFALPESQNLLYTNDARILVEILLRELPKHVENPRAFESYSNCMKALASCSEAARMHRREEALQVLEDLREDERLELSVRRHCSEVLAVLALGGG